MLADSQGDDSAAAPAGEICGLFMKTLRGGSLESAKQIPLNQWEAACDV